VNTAGTGPATGPRPSFVAPSQGSPQQSPQQSAERAPSLVRRAGPLCLAIGSFNLIALVGDLCSPLLLPHRPVLLVLLSPRTAYLVTAAHRVPFALFFAVAVVRLCAADPFHFMLGRTTGPSALAAARRIGPLRRLVDRLPPAGAVWMVGIFGSPTSKTMCAAGAAGLNSRDAAAANVAGTAGRVLVIWAAGQALPDTSAALARIAPWIALPSLLVLVATALHRHRRQRRSQRHYPTGDPDRPVPALAPSPPQLEAA
jgi:hypothetical protein